MFSYHPVIDFQAEVFVACILFSHALFLFIVKQHLLMFTHLVCNFRKKGAILNISSASGMYPVPLLTVYSASKVNGL